MTTGSKTSDLRYADSLGNPKALGLLKVRGWSGADRPSLKMVSVLKGMFPGTWHEYRAHHESFLFSEKIRGPGKVRTSRSGREYVSAYEVDFEAVDRLVARHHQVHNEYRAKMDLFLRYREAYLAQKAIEKTRSLALHDYTCSIIDSNDVPVSVKQLIPGKTWKTGVSASAMFGNPINTGSPLWTANDDNALIEKLRSKLSGVPGFHAGVALAELDRTLEMITGASKVLRRFGQRMAVRDLAGGARVLYNGSSSHSINFDGIPRAAQLYLGYQFGLKPLIHDVIDGARMLGWQATAAHTNAVRVRRTQIKGYSFYGHIGLSMLVVEQGQIVAYLTKVPSLVDVSGLSDVASMAWERLYGSFLVDWWFPVGNALAAMHTSRSLTGQFVTTRTRRQSRNRYTSGKGGYADYLILGDLSHQRTIKVTRTVSSSLIAKLPKLKPIFHPDTEVRIRHSLEAGALLVVNRKNIVAGYKNLGFHTQALRRRYQDFTEHYTD